MLFASVTDSFFDMAVKLASAGAFGICIFAILWTGWLMKSTPENAKNRHAALRNFMIMCVVIAVIAGTVGIIDSLGKASLKEKHQEEIKALEKQNQENIEIFKKVVDEHIGASIAFHSKLEGILIGKTALVNLLSCDDKAIKASLIDVEAALAKLANEK